MQGGVESLGTWLRREREQSQVSLQDTSAATKLQRKFLEAIEDTWLAVEVDGGKQRPLTLPAGQSTRWQAADRVEFLTIGNALGTRLRVNGKDVSLPSTPSNIVRNIVLTRDLVN